MQIRMFVNKHFIYFECVYLKKLTGIMMRNLRHIILLCEGEDVGRCLDLH